jgi:putative ABC transport system substrate-binding protein
LPRAACRFARRRAAQCASASCPAAPRTDTPAYLASFREGLAALGYREGENLTLDVRYANYSEQQASKLAAEIAASKPVAIVAFGGGIVPVFSLSPPVPLVFLHSGNPIDAGFANSFARPGRHATGMSLLALDLIPKRLELLREVSPKMHRVAFVASPEHAGQHRELAASRAAASQLGLDVSYHQARTPAELGTALTAVAAERPDAAMLFSDGLMVGQRRMLAAFFIDKRMPSAAGWSAFPEAGTCFRTGRSGARRGVASRISSTGSSRARAPAICRSSSRRSSSWSSTAGQPRR